jgi:hypothetical protein
MHGYGYNLICFGLILVEKGVLNNEATNDSYYVHICGSVTFEIQIFAW